MTMIATDFLLDKLGIYNVEHLPNWLSIFISWSASGTGKEIFFDFRDGGTGRVPVVIWMSSWHYRFFVVLCDG